MGRLDTVKITIWRKFLIHHGFEYHETTASHEHWRKSGILRRVTFQCTKKEIPLYIVGKNLATMNLTKRDLEVFLDRKGKM